MEVGILRDIVIIFGLSTFVNFIFTRLKIPTIIGYLFTGVIVGPKLLGWLGSAHDIELIAEIGVVLLMFSIGMEYSLNHLLKIRRTVILGGFMQLALTTSFIMLVAHWYELNWTASLFIGFMTALSSTAVVLKILQERSELSSNYGRTVVGILIFQDIIIIPLMLFTPLLGDAPADVSGQFIWLLIKAVVIIAFVYSANKWLVPWLLHVIALTRNQELFFMSVLLICLAVAMLTHEMGMSLAFGAFLGGLMISGSTYSHNAFGNIIPFKDTFTSFFFVSIGMLLDVPFVLNHMGIVLITVVLVLVMKVVWAGFTAFVLGHTFRGTVMVGIALGQVGEFSFILAKLGIDYKVIDTYHYQLFLAVAVITMAMSPFTIKIGKPLANRLLRLNLPPKLVSGLFPLKEMEVPELSRHLVLIGKDSRALNLSVMAKHMKLPYISIIFDPEIVRKRQLKGEMVIYGDAQNEPILEKAHIDTAEVVVVSIGDLITAMAIVDKVRHMNKKAFIIVRAKKVDDIENLYALGADQVIPEEFETSIDLFERIMKKYLVPNSKIVSTIAKIRDHHYGIFMDKNHYKTVSLIRDVPNIDVVAIKVPNHSPLAGKTLAEMSFRQTFGINLASIRRKNDIIDHIGPDTKLLAGDVCYVLGKPENTAIAIEMIESCSMEDPEQEETEVVHEE